MIDKALHVLEFALLCLVFVLELGSKIKAHNSEVALKETAARLERELAESEARCRRMTDTCIDIIANGRWE